MKNKIELNGDFKIWVYKFIDNKKTLIEYYNDPNTVVDVGKEKLCKMLANDGVNHYISAIGVGTSTIAPTVADTTLTDLFTKSIDGYEYPNTTSIKFNWTLSLTDAVGKAIGEYALITQDGTLFSRKTRGVINKESDVLIEGSWTISFV